MPSISKRQLGWHAGSRRQVFGALLGCVLLLPGCRKWNQEPESPADEAETPSSKPSSSDESADSEADAPEKDEGGGDEESAKKDDEGEGDEDGKKGETAELAQIIQAAMDDQELDPYWQLGDPSRVPVFVSGVPAELELKKANKPVKIVDAAEAKGKPAFVFTHVEVSGDKASVRYRYDVEHVRGSAVLNKRYGRWEITRSRVTKY